MWTDPPYGVDYIGGTGLTIANDQEPVTEPLLRDAFDAVNPHLAKGAAIYVASPAGRPGVRGGRVAKPAPCRIGGTVHAARDPSSV